MSDQPAAGKHLVERMLAGDERAFDEFFEDCFPRLFRFAVTRLGGDAAAAEEAAQATLCRAVRGLETYRGESALFTWLCTICRHEIGRQIGLRKMPPGFVSLPEDSHEARAALDSLAAELEEGPDARLRQSEVARLVHVALDNLPGRYAMALEWKYLDDLPVNEIAGRLHLGLKAAESLLDRARSAFRDGFSSLTGARPRIHLSREAPVGDGRP